MPSSNRGLLSIRSSVSSALVPSSPIAGSSPLEKFSSLVSAALVYSGVSLCVRITARLVLGDSDPVSVDWVISVRHSVTAGRTIPRVAIAASCSIGSMFNVSATCPAGRRYRRSWARGVPTAIGPPSGLL